VLVPTAPALLPRLCSRGVLLGAQFTFDRPQRRVDHIRLLQRLSLLAHRDEEQVADYITLDLRRDRLARPAHFKAWLVEDARQRVADAQMSPALDCADLAARLRTNTDAAYADLARLDLVQLTLQVVCYAAYANELLGLELRGEDVLGFWGVAMAQRGLRETAR
jgi:hypothetical protein